MILMRNNKTVCYFQQSWWPIELEVVIIVILNNNTCVYIYEAKMNFNYIQKCNVEITEFEFLEEQTYMSNDIYLIFQILFSKLLNIFQRSGLKIIFRWNASSANCRNISFIITKFWFCYRSDHIIERRFTCYVWSERVYVIQTSRAYQISMYVVNSHLATNVLYNNKCIRQTCVIMCFMNLESDCGCLFVQCRSMLQMRPIIYTPFESRLIRSHDHRVFI